MAFSRKNPYEGKGNLCSLFENAFVTTDLTGRPCGIKKYSVGMCSRFFCKKNISRVVKYDVVHKLGARDANECVFADNIYN